MRHPVICVAEDRLWCEPGVRLLIASLARHSPELAVELFFPVADARFSRWLSDYPQVTLNRFKLSEPWRGWNIKPDAMLMLFAAGYDEVLWIDSDIIVARAVASLFDSPAPESMIVAEEALCSSHYDGDAMRARSWGLDIGRALPFQLNGGIVGVTRAQIRLVEHWREVLDSAEYRAAQQLPWDQRPRHFMADQEVLTALLCSRAYADIPLRFVKRGRDVVQYLGSACYTLAERWTQLRQGPPVFIHSQGHKAWMPLPQANDFKQRLLNLYQRMSPYLTVAADYAPVLDDPVWLRPAAGVDATLRALSFGQAPLAGLPIAAFNDLYRWVRWAHTGGEPRR